MNEARSLPGHDESTGDIRDAAGPVELLVLQATPFCNLDCSYCYLPGRNDRSRMGLPVIESAIGQLIDCDLLGPELTFVWHAGEPLVPGVDYYRAAFELIDGLAPSATAVSHSFQTNAVLIDDAWCDFFEANPVRLGLSIDGPADIHDRYRKTRDGKGTHARVARAIERLHARNIPFHVIAVLTADSIREPERIYDYFHHLGIEYLCLNIEEIEAENQTSTLLQFDRREQYRRFLSRLHRLRRARGGDGLRIREIDGAISAVLSLDPRRGRQRPGNQENTPFRILSVDVNGNFATFSPELLGTSHPRYGDFSLGNLLDGRLADCFATPHYRGIADAIAAGIARCRNECEYFDLCGGGSPSNKLAENGSFDGTETGFCRLQKQACVDVALDILEEGLDIVA